MHVDLIFIVLLVCHVLGDFYLQSDKMAKERKRKYIAVIKHGLIYTFTTAVILLFCIPKSTNRLCLCVAVSMCHFGIDTIKHIIEKLPDAKILLLKKNIFIVDQAVHFLTLATCWYFFGRNIDTRWFVAQEMTHLPNLPITILLGVLLIGKPIGIWIANSNLRNYWPENAKIDLSSNSTKNAGKTIGYLERLIVLIFLMYQQFGAIAFVLTAKSVARFKDIEKDQRLAEYYLIGTLMSVVSAIVVALLLGLISTTK